MPDYRYLEFLVDITSRSKCTDPRDRIFALQSLLDPRDAVKLLEPDYGKTVAEVYIDVFFRSSLGDDKLKLLPRCELLGQKTDGMPSWLPNWTIPQQTSPLHLMYTAGRSAAVMQLVNGTRLRVHGIQFAVIEHIAYHNIEEYSTTEQAVDEILSIARQLQVCSAEYESFCFTICAGYFAHDFQDQDITPSDRLELSQALTFISGVLENSSAGVPEMSKHDYAVTNTIHSKLLHRSVYRTSNGELGLAPHSAKAGNVVVAFLGCDSPMVLWPHDGDTYEVVGESYCRGFMACEVFLGPLPTTHRLVLRMSEPMTSTVYQVFLDLSSGMTHPEDPRLDQLPRGWRFIEHNQKHIWHAFWNEETREQTFNDPRLTPEALKARGVEVRAFDLI